MDRATFFFPPSESFVSGELAGLFFSGCSYNFIHWKLILIFMLDEPG